LHDFIKSIFRKDNIDILNNIVSEDEKSKEFKAYSRLESKINIEQIIKVMKNPIILDS